MWDATVPGKHAVPNYGYMNRDHLLPPQVKMCDKCLKKARDMEILEVSNKVNNLFKKISANPQIYKNNIELTRLLNILKNIIKEGKLG